MTPSSADPTSLNDLSELPPQNRRSLWFVLGVQSLNAFNDNFVKMLLIAFAGAVAHGTDLGDSMQVYLGAIFLCLIFSLHHWLVGSVIIIQSSG